MKNVTRLLLLTLLVHISMLSLALAQQCLAGGCISGGTQFPGATQSTTSSTFVTVSTIIYAGEWQRYSVTSGTSYEWSLCSADGGNASYDSQLTLYLDDNTILCYSDDNCGDDGKIGWTATFTGFVRTKVNQYNCQTNSVNTTLVWRAVAGTSLNCGSAVNLTCGSSVTSGNLATAGGIYNPPATSCGFSTPGNEKLYSFTSTTAGTYTLEITGVNGGSGYIDYFYKTAAGGCGNAGWTCIDDLNEVGSVSFTLAAATTYYILLDAESATGTANHTFRIICPAPPPANDACAGAATISNGSSVTLDVTNATDDTAPTCSGISLATKGVWYVYNTPANTNGTVTVAGCNTNYDSRVRVYSGSCASLVCVTGDDDDDCNGPGSGLAETTTFPNSAGGTSVNYYVLITGSGNSLSFTVSSVLPLELASFTGKTESRSNMLLWETITEKNVEWHIVERSVDGVKWVETGRTAGKMESYNTVQYELEDRAPLAKAYYRLRSVDFDGAENLSSTIILTRKVEHFGITAAFPSPTKDQVTIQFESLTEENVTIQVMDISGRLVLVQEYAADNGINEAVLQLDGLQAGVYLVRISNATSTAEPMRIVKE